MSSSAQPATSTARVQADRRSAATTGGPAPVDIDTLLILGAGGDLTKRLLLPGLASLLASGWQPARRPTVLGAGLDVISEESWRTRVAEAFASAEVSGRRLAPTVRHSRYVQADVTAVDDLTRLLGECEGTPAIYFALPPAVTAKVCQALRAVELPAGTVLALEKPFGVDRETAAALNEAVSALVPEERVFRVDHFLGRGDVLNILGVRFANRLFEPIWNNNHVESIEIVYDESLGLEGRAGYYDRAGALVDMLQSHLLQVMSVLMMEPLATLDEQSFRDAKAAVLRSTRLMGTPTSASRRARYTAGTIGRRALTAYSREPDVVASRGTETLAEVVVEVQTWRWKGVPVRLRSGKALGEPRKEAVVTLKPVPHLPEGLVGRETLDSVTIGFKPPRLSLSIDVSGEGDPFDLENKDAVAEIGAGDLTAYGEVLAGILDGDPLLAVRADSAEECWRILDPVIAAWKRGEVPLDTYAAGSDGPRSWR